MDDGGGALGGATEGAGHLWGRGDRQLSFSQFEGEKREGWFSDGGSVKGSVHQKHLKTTSLPVNHLSQ